MRGYRKGNDEIIRAFLRETYECYTEEQQGEEYSTLDMVLLDANILCMQGGLEGYSATRQPKHQPRLEAIIRSVLPVDPKEPTCFHCKPLVSMSGLEEYIRTFLLKRKLAVLLSDADNQ